ncbi:MAG: alpha/beta fold hydrolase [Pseudomonadota bacterium]
MKPMKLSRRTALGLTGALFMGASLPLTALADGHADHLASLDRVELDGNTLAYLDVGASGAPAVMLIHGIPTSSYLFRDVAPRIAAAGYRVIAPDLMGFGASDKPADPAAYATEARSARLFALADHLGVEDFAIVLHDVGGITGWQMVLDAPDRLTAVVATNTIVGLAGVTPAPAVMQIMGQQATPQEVFAPMAAPEGAEDLALMWLEQGWFGPGSVPASETAVYAADIEGANVVYETFFAQAVPAFMMGEEARNAALAAYAGPTAIIFGEQDAYFDADVVIGDLQARLGTPDANITRIPDAGHYLQAHAPEAYVNALTSFLDAELAE